MFTENRDEEIFIGYDRNEILAYQVAIDSIRSHTFATPSIKPLNIDHLRKDGLFYRNMYRKGQQLWDEISNAPCSTEFAISRFLVPIISNCHWALFMDCDIVCASDINEIFSFANTRYAVQVVKHKNFSNYKNVRTKMDGFIQTDYNRKNWSSVMLFNCRHPANKRRLTVDLINSLPGKHLHNFCWLNDDEIGELPRECNYLVDVSAPCSSPRIYHYTLGGPWINNWKSRESDKVWNQAFEKMNSIKKCGNPDVAPF